MLVGFLAPSCPLHLVSLPQFPGVFLQLFPDSAHPWAHHLPASILTRKGCVSHLLFMVPLGRACTTGFLEHQPAGSPKVSFCDGRSGTSSGFPLFPSGPHIPVPLSPLCFSSCPFHSVSGAFVQQLALSFPGGISPPSPPSLPSSSPGNPSGQVPQVCWGAMGVGWRWVYTQIAHLRLQSPSPPGWLFMRVKEWPRGYVEEG